MRLNSHCDFVWETIHSRSAAALSSVAASWCRSALKHGLDPAERQRGERISGHELALAKAALASFIEASLPVLDGLQGAVLRTGCCLVLTDANGVILESRAGNGDQLLFDTFGLSAGANWSEASEGTNGIGTCLAEARTVTIHRGQHFHSRNSAMSCMDAPVHDHQGRLIGAVDISSCRSDHDEAMAALLGLVVVDAAKRIERELFLRAFDGARILCGKEMQDAGPSLIAVDRDDLVIGATRAARRAHNLTEASFQSPRPLADLLRLDSAEGFDEADRAVLRRALARANGNAAAAARSLGIGRATFYRRMKQAGLTAH